MGRKTNRKNKIVIRSVVSFAEEHSIGAADQAPTTAAAWASAAAGWTTTESRQGRRFHPGACSLWVSARPSTCSVPCHTAACSPCLGTACWAASGRSSAVAGETRGTATRGSAAPAWCRSRSYAAEASGGSGATCSDPTGSCSCCRSARGSCSSPGGREPAACSTASGSERCPPHGRLGKAALGADGLRVGSSRHHHLGALRGHQGRLRHARRRGMGRVRRTRRRDGRALGRGHGRRLLLR